MKEFSQLGIKPRKNFVGPSIIIESILGKKICIDHYKIGPSKKYVNTDCLSLQLTMEDGTKNIIWTRAQYLMEDIVDVKEEDFPFHTTIVKINQGYQFK